MIVALCVFIILAVAFAAAWADERTKRIRAQSRRALTDQEKRGLAEAVKVLDAELERRENG